MKLSKVLIIFICNIVKKREISLITKFIKHTLTNDQIHLRNLFYLNLQFYELLIATLIDDVLFFQIRKHIFSKF